MKMKFIAAALAALLFSSSLHADGIINGGASAPVSVAQGGTGDTGTAWTAYVPVVTCGAGTLTTSTPAGRWKSIGKTVYLQVSLLITTLGTCTGSLSFTLPNSFTANATGLIYVGGAYDSSSTVTSITFVAASTTATMAFAAAATTHTYYGTVVFEAT